MCEPTTIMLAISVAGAAMSYVQQQQQAKAAQSSAQQAANVNAQVYAKQQEQIDAQAAEQMSERGKQALIERAKLRVLGAESGITGNSTDQLERQSMFNEGSDMATLEGHRRNQQDQAYLDAKGGVAAAQGRMNAIKQPSLIGTGLQIAGSYYGYKGEQERVKRTTPIT